MSGRPAWHHRLVQLGRWRTLLLITGFSVTLSLALTVVAYVAFDGQPADRPAYFVPAALIPMVVAPLASFLVVRIAFELEAAHALVARQAAQLEALLTAVPLGIAHVAPDGRVRTANAHLAALVGADGARPDADWAARFADAGALAAFRGALAAGTPLADLRWAWRMPDGTPRTVRAHLVPIATAERSDGAVLVVEDVTEREARDAQALRADKLDLAARLAGGIAHDLNNLLTIVRASAATLTAAPPETVRAIDEATQRGARLTRRLLAISGRDVHEPVHQPVAPLLAGAADLMRRVLPPGITLVTGDAAVRGRLAMDRDAVEQALFNLVMNARDALGDRGTIRLGFEARVVDGTPWAVIAVSDDGPGMPPEVLARASEPFFTTKPAHLGTGLGLAIVRDTMAQHAGRFVLTSTPGAGTRAELWFPVAAGDLPTPPEGTAVPAPRHSPPPRPRHAALAGRHVLLIEDEFLVRFSTERIIAGFGATVTSVDSVEAALAWLARGEPVAAIITDVMLPGASGLDLLRTLRAQGARTPVLLVSGYAAEEVERLLADDDDAAYLGKPWEVDALEARLAALVGRGADASAG